jgi:hypothetical protein
MKNAKRFFTRNAVLIARMNLGMVRKSRSFEKAYRHNLSIMLSE